MTMGLSIQFVLGVSEPLPQPQASAISTAVSEAMSAIQTLWSITQKPLASFGQPDLNVIEEFLRVDWFRKDGKFVSPQLRVVEKVRCTGLT